MKYVVASCVRKVVNLFRLPRAQVVKVRLEPLHRPCDLFGKRDWIASQIESLGGEHARRLVISVILADERARKKCENHFGTREPYETNELLQRGAVAPAGERLQHVLRSRIVAAEKPHIRDSERGESAPSFNFSNCAKRCGLFGAGFIRTTATVGAVYDADAFSFIHCPRQISGCSGFIIGMGD